MRRMGSTNLPGAPARRLKESFGIELEDEGLLRLALVHSSYLNENPDEFGESNERLEFLGDAVIGLIVAEELYRRRPGEPEGGLTALRAALVRGQTLARVARSLDLGPQMLMGRGEAESGGRDRDSNLADALEAVTGAIFQDQGYEAARGFVLKVMAEELASSSMARETNPKSALQELVQSIDGSLPVYRVVDASGADHARTFDVEVLVSGMSVGRGTGARKSEAEQAAALQALEALGDAQRLRASEPDQARPKPPAASSIRNVSSAGS